MRRKIWIPILIILLAALAAGMAFFLLFPHRPSSADIRNYMERAYGKDFLIIDEFTHIGYTDGEPDFQQALECPAVKLQDRENSAIQFIAYAYPLGNDAWMYQDNYSQKLLIYCMRQEGLEISNEDACDLLFSFAAPCLVLTDTDEAAQQLQDMVIRFNESYRYNDKYRDGCEHFEVRGNMSVYSILAGDTSDRWPEETGPFCYDTSIEKYRRFLSELEK